jgi:hypothetical protein
LAPVGQHRKVRKLRKASFLGDDPCSTKQRSGEDRREAGKIAFMVQGGPGKSKKSATTPKAVPVAAQAGRGKKAG